MDILNNFFGELIFLVSLILFLLGVAYCFFLFVYMGILVLRSAVDSIWFILESIFGRTNYKETRPFGKTPLHQAAERNFNPEVIGLLLDRGADIHARGEDAQTPLHQAAERNENPKVIGLLLDRGADIHARDEDEQTPLHRAATGWNKIGEKPGVIELLLDRGGNIEARSKDGCTPLHHAAFTGDPMVVETLLDRGADIEARNKSGCTPLHLAAWRKREPFSKTYYIVNLLLDRGANAKAGDKFGKTPFYYARRNRHRISWLDYKRLTERLAT